MTESPVHPLLALPLADLAALVTYTLALEDVQALRVHGLLDQYVARTRRGAAALLPGWLTKAAAPATAARHTAASLAQQGVTLGALLKDVPELQLPMLIEARVMTHVQDLHTLQLTLAEALDLGLPPRRLLRALGRVTAGADKAEQRRRLREALGVTPEVWLEQAARLPPRELKALGVSLSAWFGTHRRLLGLARRTAGTWLPLGTPEAWAKDAGLHAEHAQQLGLPTAAVVRRDADAQDDARAAAPQDYFPALETRRT